MLTRLLSLLFPIRCRACGCRRDRPEQDCVRGRMVVVGLPWDDPHEWSRGEPAVHGSPPSDFEPPSAQLRAGWDG